MVFPENSSRSSGDTEERTISRVKVKVSQGSFRSSQGKTKLIQWYGPANSNGQSASMLFRKITKCSGKSRKTGTVCNSEIISGIAEGVQHDPECLEKILDLMF